MKSIHGEVLVLEKLQASTCTFTKSNFSPWVFFTLFNLCKWCQSEQKASNLIKLGQVFQINALELLAVESLNFTNTNRKSTITIYLQMDNKQEHPFVSGKEEGELTTNNSWMQANKFRNTYWPIKL